MGSKQHQHPSCRRWPQSVFRTAPFLQLGCLLLAPAESKEIHRTHKLWHGNVIPITVFHWHSMFLSGRLYDYIYIFMGSKQHSHPSCRRWPQSVFRTAPFLQLGCLLLAPAESKEIHRTHKLWHGNVIPITVFHWHSMFLSGRLYDYIIYIYGIQTASTPLMPKMASICFSHCSISAAWLSSVGSCRIKGNKKRKKRTHKLRHGSRMHIECTSWRVQTSFTYMCMRMACCGILCLTGGTQVWCLFFFCERPQSSQSIPCMGSMKNTWNTAESWTDFSYYCNGGSCGPSLKTLLCTKSFLHVGHHRCDSESCCSSFCCLAVLPLLHHQCSCHRPWNAWLRWVCAERVRCCEQTCPSSIAPWG